MTIRELDEADHAAWNRFVGANAFGDALQAWEWGLVKSRGGDWRPLRLAVFDDTGAIRAGLAILARTLPVFGTIYYAPRGPILDDWSDQTLLADLIVAVKARALADGAILLKIDPAMPVGNAAAQSVLSSLGFIRPPGQDAQGFGGTQPKAVMILEIAGKTEDELLMAFKPQCRRNVRIAEKKGVALVEPVTREHLKPFYEILTVTAKRDGFTVRPLSYFEKLWDDMIQAGLGRLFLTEFEGQYLSGALCLMIGDKCVYLYGASSNEHRNIMPNYAMQWAMIRWALASGCRTYDFRGVAPIRPGEESSPEAEHLQGLNRFKEGFGAEFVEYIGEFDLPLDNARYWLWTRGKPAAAKLLRKLRPQK
jgi:peptidoglycan pentaglycine glycine transferase (the first glycine)